MLANHVHFARRAAVRVLSGPVKSRRTAAVRQAGASIGISQNSPTRTCRSGSATGRAQGETFVVNKPTEEIIAVMRGVAGTGFSQIRHLAPHAIQRRAQASRLIAFHISDDRASNRMTEPGVHRLELVQRVAA